MKLRPVILVLLLLTGFYYLTTRGLPSGRLLPALRDDNAAPTCRSTPNNDADNPQIRILAPALGKILTPPLDIELKFIPAGSNAIRPDTFRVCYMGLVTMDITKRITDRVPVTDKGLRVTGAQLPHGHHRLVMLVADERGRLARSEAVFDID